MGRDLTSLRCTFNGKPLLVLTSHLESEKQNSDERKAQFSQVGEPTKPFRGVACVAGATMHAVDHHHNDRAVVTTVYSVCREGGRYKDNGHGTACSGAYFCYKTVAPVSEKR